MEREKQSIARLTDQYRKVTESIIADGYRLAKNPDQIISPKQLFENIWVVGGDWPNHISGAYVYFVGNQRRGILVEAGCREGAANVIQNLIPIGSPYIEAVYLTHFHPDHAEASKYWQDAKVPVFGSKRGVDGVNRLDPLVYLPEMYHKDPVKITVDGLIEDEESIEHESVMMQAYSTLGHTNHDTSYIFYTYDKKGRKVRVGFGGDTVYGGAIDGMSDLECWRESLKLIDYLRLDYYLIGHIKPVIQRRKRTLSEQFTQSTRIYDLPLSFKSMRTPWL